ncbi:MerR family transcriptional regulator [Faecalibacter macacae]|uniref:MerR family transcriptional regulator n=1 Tax=Faecalibacter macacae TaxID=1859289 RepID=A0A3L9MEZ0_9FLAO|nr:MerR family transcriptional regulator [Faecalibacter macacae]
MKRYTIDQLSHLSGLPDTTILFWHKKYNVFPDIIPTKDRRFKYNRENMFIRK